MRVLWRPTAACWPKSALLVAAALLLFPTEKAFAQSADGVAISAAAGRSLADAVSQNEKALIDQQVLGAPPPRGQHGW